MWHDEDKCRAYELKSSQKKQQEPGSEQKRNTNTLSRNDNFASVHIGRLQIGIPEKQFIDLHSYMKEQRSALFELKKREGDMKNKRF